VLIKQNPEWFCTLLSALIINLKLTGTCIHDTDLFQKEVFHIIYANQLDDQKGYVLDGELMVKEKDGSYMSRKKANGILNKAIKGSLSDKEKEDIYAVIWDILPTAAFERGEYDVTYADRLSYLTQRFEVVNRFDIERRIELLPTVICGNMEDAMKIYNEFIAKGSEGAVLKEMTGTWKNKRVNHHIKMKIENECELKIVAVEQGAGRLLGKLGAFVCESKCGGLKVSVGSGFSDIEREEFFSPDLVGKIVTVKFNEVISSKNAGTKSLFLPIFVKVRDDKGVADTLRVIESK